MPTRKPPRAKSKAGPKAASPDALCAFITSRPRPRKLGDHEFATAPKVLKRQRVALQKWQTAALGHIARLMGEPVAVPGATATAAPPAALQLSVPERRLLKRAIDAASDAATDLAIGAARGHHWAAARSHARAAVSLRRDTAARAGIELRASARAHGLEALATYMLEGNTPHLRDYLRDTIASGADTPGLRAMAARYLIMAGDYQGAARSLADERTANYRDAFVLRRILATANVVGWEQYPCNYYTYRYSLVDNDRITLIVQSIIGGGSSSNQRIRDALECHRLWNNACAAFDHANHLPALRFYTQARSQIEAYFARHYNMPLGSLLRLQTGSEPLLEARAILATHFRKRYSALSLDELHEIDWVRPRRVPPGFDPYMGQTVGSFKWVEKMEAPLATMLLVFIPLALAEIGKARHRYGDSDEQPGLGRDTGALTCARDAISNHDAYKVMSEFIERPFAAILKGQILLQKADDTYKVLGQVENPQELVGGRPRYRETKAASLYQGVLNHFLEAGHRGYSDNLEAGLQAERQDIAQALVSARGTSIAAIAAKADRFREARLGLMSRIPGLVALTSQPAGIIKATSPPEALIAFVNTQANVALRESNPLVYAIIADAKAGLLKLGAGLNYLGYRSDYVPPWRFTYLLERARYFVGHAIQVQSTYLNFLANAEREDLQERSAAQTVALERSNVDVETRRVDHARAQLGAAQASTQLAAIVEANAMARFTNYLAFDAEMDRLTQNYVMAAGANAVLSGGAAAIGMGLTGAGLGATFGSPIGLLIGVAAGVETGPGMAATGAAGALVGGAFGAPIGFAAGALIGGGPAAAQFAMQWIEKDMQNVERWLEKSNLQLAIGEAAQGARVAAAEEQVAQTGVYVAAMQRTAALMRHEFSRQTLEFLRNRSLNSEMWYRLADTVRVVAERYLQYGIEFAFLAEQACEFETSRRLDVIRFDYDLSEIGDFLAGDLLLRDLDSLEHGFVTEARTRRQRLRYVLSMARECPDALQQLRDTGSCIVSTSLPAIERRFAGLYNARLASLGIQPFALMDPTRFAMQVSHLGDSKVRVPSTGDTTGVRIPSWCAATNPALDEAWPVLLRVTAPDTQLYSGMTRQDEINDDRFFEANQRAAFEGLGAASSWRIDMSMTDNGIEPSTLVDVLLTLNLTGYHSDELKAKVQACLPSRSVQTLTLGRSSFADGFYDLHHRGRMTWAIDPSWTPSGQRAGRLRNFGVSLLPEMRRPTFGRILGASQVTLDVSAAGTVTIVSPVPRITFAITRLTLSAAVLFDGPVTSAHWNFGSDADPAERTWIDIGAAGAALAHIYSQPGSYVVTLRVISGGRLFDFTANVAVSATTDLSPPATADPTFVVTGQTGSDANVRVGLQGAGAAPLTMRILWKGGRTSSRGQAMVALRKGERHDVLVLWVRDLKVSVTGTQRYAPTARLIVQDLRLATSRTFSEPDGALTTNPAAYQGLTKHLFEGGELSPLDTWQLALTATDNPFLQTVDASDTPTLDLSEIADAVLSLEYETTS